MQERYNLQYKHLNIARDGGVRGNCFLSEIGKSEIFYEKDALDSWDGSYHFSSLRYNFSSVANLPTTLTMRISRFHFFFFPGEYTGIGSGNELLLSSVLLKGPKLNPFVLLFSFLTDQMCTCRNLLGNSM